MRCQGPSSGLLLDPSDNPLIKGNSSLGSLLGISYPPFGLKEPRFPPDTVSVGRIAHGALCYSFFPMRSVNHRPVLEIQGCRSTLLLPSLLVHRFLTAKDEDYEWHSAVTNRSVFIFWKKQGVRYQFGVSHVQPDVCRKGGQTIAVPRRDTATGKMLKCTR